MSLSANICKNHTKTSFFCQHGHTFFAAALTVLIGFSAVFLQAGCIQPEHNPSTAAIFAGINIAICLYVNAYNNLAVLYGNMGRYAEALDFHEKSLALKTQILPAQHPGIALSMNNLANTHLTLGAADKALPFLQQALAIRRANFADSHPDIAQTLVNLGRAYAALGRNAEAEAHLREGLKLRESAKSVGLIAYALEQLAPVLRANKKPKEAATMEKRAASLRKQAG